MGKSNVSSESSLHYPHSFQSVLRRRHVFMETECYPVRKLERRKLLGTSEQRSILILVRFL